MKTSNPFEVLGLDPRLVTRLKPRQLDQLIAVTGRTLKAMFHPDQADGGNVDRFNEINSASLMLHRINNPEAFEKAKKQFLDKARRSKTTLLQLELDEVRTAGASALYAFADYLLKTSTPSAVPVVNRLMGYRVKILDRVMQMLAHSQRYKSGSHIGFHDLEFTEQGNFHVSEKGKSRLKYKRTPVGAIPLVVFQKMGGLEKFLAATGEPAPRQLTSPSDVKEMFTLRSAGLASKSFRQENAQIRHLQNFIKYEFNMQQMLKVVNHLSAEVKRDHVLISVVNTEQGPAFYAEGVILGVEPLT